MTDEEWRPIRGFSAYAVSSQGRVKRVEVSVKGHQPGILKSWLGNHGYETVGLNRHGKSYRRLVHRLVCEAFHGEPASPAHQVAHGDGTRRNNHADNLRWATRSENMADALAHGSFPTGMRHGRTLSPERTPRGERHGHAKLSERDVQSIRRAASHPGSGRRLAAQYGVSPATVSMIRAGKIWTHISGENHG